MANVVEILKNSGGCGRWKHLRQAGVSATTLQLAVNTGQVVRYARGVYGLPNINSLRVAMHRSGGMSACLSAANERGWWVLNIPEKPHISVDRGGPLDEFVKHRSKLPLTDLDVVLQVLLCAPELDALVVVTSAVRQKRVLLAELLARLQGQRHGKARAIVGRIDSHAESVLEVASRYHLENAGFVVSSQVYLPGMGRMDQLINGVLALELMGKEYHLSPEAFAEDLRRFNRYTVSGVPVLRVGYVQVVHRPEEFIALVRQALDTISRSTPH